MLEKVAKEAKIEWIFHKRNTERGFAKSKAYKKHQLISTHTARRSFATNLYKTSFPAISIMQITGHKTEQAFLKYIKVTPDEHARMLIEHWEKRNQHLKIV
jgi:integrase